MSVVLDKYELSLGTIKIYGKEHKILKTKTEDLEYLQSFLFDNKNINILDAYIREIREIISGERPSLFGPSNDIFIDIGQTNTDFRYMDIQSDEGYTDVQFSIPTQDFLEILIEWKKFVEKPIE